MLNLAGFFVFCGMIAAALYLQEGGNKRNRFPPNTNIALGDVLAAVYSLQALLDGANLNELNCRQVNSIRAAQFKLETALAAYARQPEQVR